MKKLVYNSVVGIIEHHIVYIPVTNEVTDHRMFYTVHLIGVGVCRTIFVKLVHLLHSSYACLLSFCGSAVVIRITLSFPTARSIFALPAVYIYKIVPSVTGEMPYDRSGILVIIAVLLIVERNVIAVLRRATAACKLCNICIAQTACLEHLSLLMFSAENIEQVLPRAVVLLADRLIAQSGIFLHELLTLISVTLDVLGELFDLAIILSDLFRIECYGNHLTFIFVISHIP